jgi:NADH-quinone oxidoreductase subunit F
VVLVLDGSVDAGDIVGRITEFFRHESCGQCVPCRVGTQRQHETVARIRTRGRTPEDDAILADLDAVMTDASICGLGQTAAGAVRSALALGLLEDHR